MPGCLRMIWRTADIHLLKAAVSLWQSSGKVEKFDCVFWRLDAR
jgi:hypothetical protein